MEDFQDEYKDEFGDVLFIEGSKEGVGITARHPEVATEVYLQFSDTTIVDSIIKSLTRAKELFNAKNG